MLLPQPTSLHSVSHSSTPKTTTTSTRFSSSPILNSTNDKVSLQFNNNLERDPSYLASEIRQKARGRKYLKPSISFAPWFSITSSQIVVPIQSGADSEFRLGGKGQLTPRLYMGPSLYPISTILESCGSLRAIRSGKEVHCFMIRHNSHDLCTCSCESALVDFYSKCRVYSAAQNVFGRMPVRDVVA